MNIQLKYFLINFQLFYNLEEEVIVGYSKENSLPVNIIPGADESFWDGRKAVNAAEVVWKKWKNVNIPFLFGENTTADILTVKSNQIIINYDIVASTFYILSGWDEIVNWVNDNYGRFSYGNSLVKNLAIINLPVVNYYFDIFSEALHLIGIKCQKKNLWNGKEFATVLTHDIDICRSGWLEGSFSEIKKRRFNRIPGLLFNRFVKGKDEWFNFEVINQIEQQFNVSSSYYFLARKGKTRSFKNADYHISDKDIQEIINLLRDEGHDIGIHGSPGTHLNSEKLKEEIRLTNHDTIYGNRFHYLLFDPLKTPAILQESGLRYDTTLSFAEHPGFRRGTCYPFYLFDFEHNSISTVLEIPLIAMDISLAHKKYMNLSQDESFKKIVTLINVVRKQKGVFTLLWHNTFFSDFKYSGWSDVYKKILDYACKENALLTNARDVYEKIIKNA